MSDSEFIQPTESYFLLAFGAELRPVPGDASDPQSDGANARRGKGSRRAGRDKGSRRAGRGKGLRRVEHARGSRRTKRIKG